jgi:hypothetical protein
LDGCVLDGLLVGLEFLVDFQVDGIFKGGFSATARRFA